jgi:parallel beta-helix repeat protein
MIRLNLNHAAVLVVLLLLAPAVSHAAESFDNCTGFIDSLPAVISTQGTWCVRHDLSTAITGGNAITVSTNNVTIDCNNYKLGDLAAGAGTEAVGIYGSPVLNTTVRRCNIRGFAWGLYITGGGNTIEDNRFDGNTFTAIELEGDGSVVRRNSVVDTGGSTSILIGGTAMGIITVNSVDVQDNTVSGVAAGAGAAAAGINSHDNPDGTIARNRVRGLSGDNTYGIYSFEKTGAGRIAIRDNDLVGEASVGSIGLHCETTNGRAMDNVINGFETGNDGCADDGGNVIVP